MSEPAGLRALPPALYAAAVVIALAVVNVALLQIPPAPVPADAPDDVFSAERAFAIVEAIAQHPHRIGTVENVRVRDELVARFKAAGYEPVIQQDALVSGRRYAVPHNVYAMLRGHDPTGTVVVMAHYDSVPFGPGAADDATGVAAVIEAARAMRLGPAPRNNILFLCTDGEEKGLLGARTLLAHHPERHNLRLALNFEARGHYGPSMMFHTGPNNGRLIEGLMAGAPYPVASSFMFDVARRMPTTTDYWALKAAGVPGLDFAFVNGIQYYHTMNDRPAHLSLRSVQHHGSYALGLARYFGEADLAGIDSQPDVVYFNTLGPHMVSYSTGWIGPLVLLATLLYAVVLGVGFRRGEFTWGGMLRGFATFLASALLVPVLLAGPLVWGFQRFGPYALYNQPYYEAAFVLLTLAVCVFAFGWAARYSSPGSLLMGALVWAFIALYALSWYLPLGSHLLAWPLIGVLSATLVLLCLPRRTPCPVRHTIIHLGSAAALVLIAPTIASFFATVTVAAGPVIMMGAVLMLGLLFPQLCYIARPFPRALPLALLLCSLPLFGVAIYYNAFDPDRPQMTHLCYGAAPNDGRATWMTRGDAGDVWSAQFFDGAQTGSFAEFDPGNARAYTLAPAPVVTGQPPRVEVVSDLREAGGRQLQLHVTPAYEAAGFRLFTPRSLEVHAATVNGQAAGGPSAFASWLVEYVGRADDGVRVSLTVAPGTEVELHMVELYYDLLGLRAGDYKPRPDWIVPEPNTMPEWDFTVAGWQRGDLLRFDAGLRSGRSFLRYRYTFPVAASASR